MGARSVRRKARAADTGDTFLPGGVRVAKSDPRIAALGDVDELNCVLGLLRPAVGPAARRLIGSIQSDLFDLGADLSRTGAIRGGSLGELRSPATAGVAKGNGRWKTSVWRMEHGRAARLEREAMAFGKGLKPLRGFVVPGGPAAAAWCHLARAVCRRAERSAVRASCACHGRHGDGRSSAVAGAGNPEAVRYLNRLSGLLFVLARRLAGTGTVEWRPTRPLAP
jgi:cob(I)alamin adenosyltransferase